MDNVDLLRKKAFEGLEEKGLADSQKYIDRLNYELEVVEKEGFTPYFLVLWDIAKYARENGIIYGPGRGSGSGSLLNYCLRITLVDPLKYDLLFERFLNPDRVSPPDIDWDVADRDKIIEYIEKRYGRDRVARVGTINFLRTRSAIRDVGRVLGKERKFIDELAGMVPPPIAGLWDTFEKECEREPKLLNSEYADIIGPVGRLWSVARSYGTHAGGVAIAPGPINAFVPLYKDKDGNPVCQFDWRDLETAGLLKFDILGVKGLRVIQLCIDYLKEDRIEADVTLLEDGDEATYELICKGDLDGVFQLGGSESIKQLTVNILPRNINDISLVNALFRPGPLISGMLSKAVEARQGKKATSYIHPSLEPILKDTYGVCIYQEQAMRIAVDLAGFSGGESDILRKVIGKKLKEKMAEQEEKLVSGMVRNGISKKTATEISDMIKGSAQYSFNKCLAENTEVLLLETSGQVSSIPISEIKILVEAGNSPSLVSFNPETEDIQYDTCVEVIDTGEQEVYEVELSDGSIVLCTMEHKFLCSNMEKHPLREILANDLEIIAI
jgi:DNA polymerase-3 subunit alpha